MEEQAAPPDESPEAAAYTLGHQLLFPLRGLPRKTSRGRAVVMLAATLVLANYGAVAVLA